MELEEKRGTKRKIEETETSIGKDADVNVIAPREISIVDFVKHRAIEMEAMEKAVKVVGASRNVFQNLPKHMRRRAASHHVKRLPRRIRQIAQQQMEKAPPRHGKRPSRYHRRRPRNLLDEYNRRKRRNVWLETHIWHAKRFHMTDKWGYRLPLHPNDKSYRAAFKASSQHSLLMDMSYYCCIELTGLESDVIEVLRPMMPAEVGRTLGAKMYLEGGRQGTIILYDGNSYPYGAVGEVLFHWKPKMVDASNRTLWLWVHPSCFERVMSNLKTLSSATPNLLGENKLDNQNIDESRVVAGNNSLVDQPYVDSVKSDDHTDQNMVVKIDHSDIALENTSDAKSAMDGVSTVNDDGKCTSMGIPMGIHVDKYNSIKQTAEDAIKDEDKEVSDPVDNSTTEVKTEKPENSTKSDLMEDSNSIQNELFKIEAVTVTSLKDEQNMVVKMDNCDSALNTSDAESAIDGVSTINDDGKCTSMGIHVDKSNNIEQTSEDAIKDEDINLSDSVDNSTTEVKREKSENATKSDLIDKDSNKVQNEVFQIGAVTVTSLKDELIRFRLTGPLTIQVLLDTLRMPEVSCTDNQDGEGDKCTTENGETSAHPKWWQTYYMDTERKSLHARQWERFLSYSNITGPSCLPPNMVHGLTVQDPRLCIPRKKKVLPDPQAGGNHHRQQYSLGEHIPDLATSPLWCVNVRQEVKASKLVEHKLNSIRSKNLVPGMPIDLGNEESKVPIIVIQNPGVQETGYSSGCDVILPTGWSMAFWVAMVYRGARVGGIRELQCINEEAGKLTFPYDFPDTPSGQIEEDTRTTELQEKYKRYPPDKRPNYAKLGVNTPFHCPWRTLVEDWKEHIGFGGHSRSVLKDGRETFYVLRSTFELKCLDKKVLQNIHLSEHPSLLNNLPLEVVQSETVDLDLLAGTHIHSLIPVRLSMVNKGQLDDFAMICIASEDDLRQLNETKIYGGPLEPKHKDMEQIKKKTEKKLIKLQQKMNKMSKPKVKITLSDEVATLSKPQSSTVSTQSEDTNAVNGRSFSLIDTNGRPIIGFVRHGKFSYTLGKGTGIGFCSLIGLVRAVNEKPRNKNLVVLTRNTNTLQYRFANLSIIL